MREAIFELHLLMMAPFCEDVITPENQFFHLAKEGEREKLEQRAKEGPNFWAGIVQGGN